MPVGFGPIPAGVLADFALLQNPGAPIRNPGQDDLVLGNYVEVRGAAADPLFKWLEYHGGKAIQDNWEKYLINEGGQIVAHYDSTATYTEIEKDIKELLKWATIEEFWNQ